jgi:ABC-type nitrate/sulfonate/bicarbonate transport system permease component
MADAFSVGSPRATSPRGALARGVRAIGDSRWALRAICWGSLLVVWQLIAITQGPSWWPTVPATAEAMVEVFENGYYLTLLDSLEQMFAGFAITLVVAIPMGVAMGRSRIADGLLSPWVTNLFSSPKEALLPLLIILFGTGFEYRVAIVILFAIFFVVMNTAAGVRYVDASLLETARAFRTPRLRMTTQILLPAAAPFVVAGTRLGLGMALKAMVIAELWVSHGTGGLIDQAAEQRDLPMFFALATLVIVVAATISQSLLWVESRLRRGQEPAL